MNIRPGLVAGALLALFLVGGSMAGASRSPSLELQKATVDRAEKTVDLRLRICFSSGPRAKVVVSERRTVHGVVQASRRWTVPQGVRPDHIAPFACRSGWRVNWLLRPRLAGPGVYTVALRVRDAYGRWTGPVGLSVTSP